MAKMIHFMTGMVTGMVIATYSRKIRSKLCAMKENASQMVEDWKDSLMEGEEIDEESYDYPSQRIKTSQSNSRKNKRSKMN